MLVTTMLVPTMLVMRAVPMVVLARVVMGASDVSGAGVESVPLGVHLRSYLRDEPMRTRGDLVTRAAPAAKERVVKEIARAFAWAVHCQARGARARSLQRRVPIRPCWARGWEVA